MWPHTPQAFLETPRKAGHILLEGQPQISLISHVEILNMEGTVRRGLQFTVLIQEDLKVLPFADVITKAAPSPQLF